MSPSADTEANVMHSEKDKNDTAQSKRDPYDAAVLQFLDQEIKRSSRRSPELKPPADDVDAIVDSLLKESMHATDTPPTARDSGTEELDLLFSKIFKDDKAAVHAETEQVHLLEDAQTSRKLEDLSLSVTETVELQDAVAVASPEPAAAASVQAPVPEPVEKVAPMAVPAPLRPVLQTGRTVEHVAIDAVSPGSVETEAVKVFHLPPPKRAWNWRMAAIAAAFLCLVAAMGILLTTGSRNGAPSPSGQPSLPATQPAASNAVAREVHPPAADSAAEPRTAAARTARTIDPVKTAEASRTDNPGRAVPPGKEGKPAAGAQPAPATGVQPPPAATANQNLTATVTSEPVEKPAAMAASPAETPAVGLPVRAVETAPPPPAPEPVSNTVNPKSAASLEDPASSKRPAVQPLLPAPAVPKKATPAIVISKVLPVYPEMARKSRITGTVTVEVMIDETGRVTKATPMSGPAILQTEAANAVLRWQFRPANIEGIPVPSSNQVSIIFK
jgi:periplasmic protein TonB